MKYHNPTYFQKFKSKLKGNYLALANLALSLMVLCQVQLINMKLNALGQMILNIGLNLFVELQEAKMQFGAAISSILQLFGGDGA